MSDVHVLSAAGVSVALDVAGPDLPRVLHWGSPIGAVDDASIPDEIALISSPGRRRSAADSPVQPSLLPSPAQGWLGLPGLSGFAEGRPPNLRLRLTDEVGVDSQPGAGGAMRATAGDPAAGIQTHSEINLSRDGIVAVRHQVTNTGGSAWLVGGVRSVLPVPDRAAELMDWTGRWGYERSPQRQSFTHGVRSRQNRRGRTGHDAPGLVAVGTAGFGFGHGEVWGVHLAWSGNHVHDAERLSDGWSMLGAAELLEPGEVVLGPGETYEAPWAYFGYSAHGLDGLSERFHSWLRRREVHPRTPRPVVLNTWEAVYFDHTPERFLDLADRAAAVGVERFVLDDGWFRNRRDATAGLGDWYVDGSVWPDGLHPLVERVREHGMEFGLWVEPEMVNLDSDLARGHPDWLLASPGELPRPWRHQHTLDLAKPEVFEFLIKRLDALVTEYRIDFLKWDHNRDLLEAVHDGRPGVHAQTSGVYRLIDELRRRHPALEVESCASGGGRIDLGILERTDRVWASDSNDPIDRLQIQRGLSVLVPPELIGSHVGPSPAHLTDRTTSLRFRCATALFCHAGIEWDLTSCSDDEISQLESWTRLYKRLRPILHSGRSWTSDTVDRAYSLHGVVSHDRRHVVAMFACTASSATVLPPRLLIPGLRHNAEYQLDVVTELSDFAGDQWQQPPWIQRAPFVISGAAVAAAGLQAPLLNPGQAVVLVLNAEAGP